MAAVCRGLMGATAGLALAAVAAPAVAQGGPAEIPPESFKGQQYVDSRGCLFVRAGVGAETLWVPRVAPGGAQICGEPPSGQRVPVVGEGERAAAGSVGNAGPTAGAGPLVAIGSFRDPANAERAAARLADLGYPVVQQRMTGAAEGLVAVLAGPFASSSAAEDALAVLRASGYPDAVVVGR